MSYTRIKSFLASAACKKLKVNYIDIKSAFLPEALEQDAFIAQPEGQIVPGEENKICKLNKATYSLKQAEELGILK